MLRLTSLGGPPCCGNRLGPLLPPRLVKRVVYVRSLKIQKDSEPSDLLERKEGLLSLAPRVLSPAVSSSRSRKLINEPQHTMSHAAMISFSTYLLGTVGKLTGMPDPSSK